jgi:hypothetical protein
MRPRAGLPKQSLATGTQWADGPNTHTPFTPYACSRVLMPWVHCGTSYTVRSRWGRAVDINEATQTDQINMKNAGHLKKYVVGRSVSG